MGLLGNLALGALDALLSSGNSSGKRSGGATTAVIFDPDGLSFPFSDKDLRNETEHTLLAACAQILNLQDVEDGVNFSRYVDAGAINAFVVTNGRTTIQHDLWGMGKCGIIVSGVDATETLQQIIEPIQKLGFSPIEYADDTIPFHEKDWLDRTKSRLEEKTLAQIESEDEDDEEESMAASDSTVGRDDMLKTLVFMFGNNVSFDRDRKKGIAEMLSHIYDEKISLFSIEDKIDAAYTLIEAGKLRQFFSGIATIDSDREGTCAIYTMVMLLYMELKDKNAALPAYAYNLALIKRFFAISRSELVECYEALASKFEKDTDDIADEFEELTSDKAMKAIEAENPTFAYDESKDEDELKEESSNSAVCESPKEEIEKTYYASVQAANGNDDFKTRFFLADSNPKKVIAAVNAYAKNCKGEEILAAYDDSAFGNGKVGFLLSNKKLYICNSFEKPQEIELSAVQLVKATPKSMNSFITVNDIKIDTAMVNGAGAELVADFLTKAIPLAMQIEEQSE